MHAELVMIGTELLLGEIVDTNANLLAKMLREIGLDLYYKTTVGDNETRITDVLNLALERSDVVITSGGLGPTVDDITRQAVANATGRKLVYSTELEAQIAERFRSFGRPMADNNKRQAYLPEGAIPLRNPVGTAPCFLSEDVRGRGFIISLPGVPRELEYMMKHTIVPLLIERLGGIKVTKVRVLRTCAVGESNIDRAIGDLMISGNPTVGLAAHSGQTDVRIVAKADSEIEVDALIAPMEAELRKRLGVAIYGTGQETVSQIVGRLLAEKELKLGIIDTLTGGQIAQHLIDAGFEHLLASNFFPADASQAIAVTQLPPDTNLQAANGATLTAQLAARVAPARGVGLAMVGPLAGDEANHFTFIALHGPGSLRHTEPGRNYQDGSYIKRWLTVQGLDWIRRAVLGQLTSPVD